jgi:hypothetical protein
MSQTVLAAAAFNANQISINSSTTFMYYTVVYSTGPGGFGNDPSNANAKCEVRNAVQCIVIHLAEERAASANRHQTGASSLLPHCDRV